MRKSLNTCTIGQVAIFNVLREADDGFGHQKRRKRMSKKKHRKMLRKTRHQRK